MDTKNLMYAAIGAIVGTAVGLGAGYHKGRHNYEPVGVSNLNVNPAGPQYLMVETKGLMTETYFEELDKGSFRKRD